MSSIILQIESKDEFGESSNNSYSAELSETDKGKKYIYRDEFGENKILVTNGLIKVIRKGKINSSASFKRGEITQFSYNAEMMIQNFNIFTHNIVNDDNEIRIEYNLLLNGDEVNKISIKFKVINLN